MREKLIKLLDDFSTPVMLLDTKLMDWKIPTQQIREALADHLIANDVVQVVRCKDCKHWLKDVPGCTDFVGRCEWANYMVGAVGYCVYGERK